MSAGAYHINASGTISTGGASQVVLGANPGRQVLHIQNPIDAPGTLYVNTTGGAASSSAKNCFELGPGGALEFENSKCPTNQISVTAVTTGHAYIAVWA